MGCAVEGPFSTISNLNILQIADLLAKPYGVDIVDNLKGETEPIEEFNVNVGSTVFAEISRAAGVKGCSVTDDEKGRLLITRAGTAKASTALRSGPNGNILSGSGNFDISQRYRKYVCDGQGKGNDQNFGAAVSEVEATVEEGVKRNRTLHIRGEGLMDLKKAQDRARWEASSRMGKSVSLTLNVQGWRQDNGGGLQRPCSQWSLAITRRAGSVCDPMPGKGYSPPVSHRIFVVKGLPVSGGAGSIPFGESMLCGTSKKI